MRPANCRNCAARSGLDEQRVQQTDAQRAALESQLQQAETRLAELHERHTHLARRVAAAEAELGTLEKARVALRQTATQQSSNWPLMPPWPTGSAAANP